MRKANGAGALDLGSNVIELLLAQRRPMLMVDRVVGFHAGPPPTIHASRWISANEVFFEGHFPGLHLWPGCLTIEGMGQSGALLVALLAVRKAAEAESGDPEAGLEALRNMELGYALHPGHRTEEAARFLAGLRQHAGTLSVGAAVDVKLTRAVFAGQRLDYRASLVRELGDLMRMEVEASVDGQVVAHGTMTGARVHRPIAPAPGA